MRIGSVPYLNAKPLVWGLDREPEVEVVYEVPSRLAGMLEADEIAAGMVSSAALFQNPDLQIAPGMSISSIGPAESVKLFHNVPVASVRWVALDTSSLTSVLLARIILAERYGLEVEYIAMPPSLPEMLDAADAAVTIGDPTMCAPAGRWSELDLGLEWYELTSLPFVFAVWAVNPDLAESELQDILLRSKAFGLDRLDEISESESRRLGLSVGVCHHYLSEIMDYDLTDRHLEGLMLFREKARRHGYAPSDHEIGLYSA